VAERAGSGITQVTAVAGELGGPKCVALAEHFGGAALRSHRNCPGWAIAPPQWGGRFSATASNTRSSLACSEWGSCYRDKASNRLAGLCHRL
jgi:hypothetical protein